MELKPDAFWATRTETRARSVSATSLLPMVLVVLALGLLTACGHRADVMKPAAVAAAGTSRVDLVVATTRMASPDPALLFTGERGNYVSINNVVVSIPPEANRKTGEIAWPGNARSDPLKSFVTVKAAGMSESQAFDWFKRRSGPKRRALIFVHGFNTSYAEAVFRFAQISHDIKVDAAPVLFTWPSRNNVLDYVYDRESTIYSRFGLVQVLDEAIKSGDVDDITILSHSMGTWLTMEALREIAIRDRKLSPKITNVVLASPDIDIDVFRRQLVEMGKKRPAFTVITSRNDLALAMSKWIAGDVDRVGGGNLEREKDLLASDGVSVIDASDYKQSDPLGHNAFAQSSDMLKALAKRISSQSLGSRALSPLGERLLARTGS